MVDHGEIQQALSARIDGEPTGLDDAVVDAHVANCAQCKAYWDKALSLSQTLAFVDVDGGMAPPKDLTDSIMAGVEPEWRRFARRRHMALLLGRLGLVALGLWTLVWALITVAQSGPLLGTTTANGVLDPVADPHTGALLLQAASVRFGFALALLLCAWRPSQIPGVTMIAGSVFAFTLGFAVRDYLVLGDADNWGDMGVLFLSCVVLVWTWIADRGGELRRMWRTLNAQPA
ncbi:zf-HC2 domain-containing protein [Corynebacterium cystitidis]|uniref:zf-HC2 domain-containing protein n=1 Tax=Corynebacterium cystitidis TaxID=35757 RepID=UPI00211EEFFE|nr:zf-HC2 domain-containing protein [Corynebacterium cystitidis]